MFIRALLLPDGIVAYPSSLPLNCTSSTGNHLVILLPLLRPLDCAPTLSKPRHGCVPYRFRENVLC